jgi:hypothetical protein
VQEVSSNTFIPPHPLKTAVLFLVFNRPDTTKQVFEAIHKAKPPRLYVAADGPRVDKSVEQEKCEQVRQIATQVDWECEVKTLFRDKNLGCKIAVSSAIDWFFENEEEGIILEDDCLPSQSFFWFCEELLERYREDMRIGMISGNNLFEQKTVLKESYFYSYGNIWGWASWRRCWVHYDVEMKLWEDTREQNHIKYFIDNDYIFTNLAENFNRLVSGDIDTWDYQWLFARLSNKLLTINPSKNLVSNIGFGEDSTHTEGVSVFSNLKKYELSFPLRHPKHVSTDIEYVNSQYASIPIRKKIKSFILNKLKRIRFY